MKEQIISREHGRDLIVRFNSDARTEFKSNAQVRVRGTGIFARNNDGNRETSRMRQSSIIAAANCLASSTTGKAIGMPVPVVITLAVLSRIV